MNRLFKRELIFLGIAAVVVAVYLFAGLRLAPSVPPEPEPLRGGVITSDEIGQILEQGNRRRRLQEERNAAIVEYNRFLRVWFQWGAGVGVLLVVVYTLWRPPWFVAPPGDPNKVPKKKARDLQTRARQRSPFGGRISNRAMLMMLATVILLITGIVLLVAVLGM